MNIKNISFLFIVYSTLSAIQCSTDAKDFNILYRPDTPSLTPEENLSFFPEDEEIALISDSDNEESSTSDDSENEHDMIIHEGEEIYPELTGIYRGISNGTWITLQLNDVQGTYRRIANGIESSGFYTVDFDNTLYIILQGENEHYFFTENKLIRNHNLAGEILYKQIHYEL